MCRRPFVVPEPLKLYTVFWNISTVFYCLCVGATQLYVVFWNISGVRLCSFTLHDVYISTYSQVFTCTVRSKLCAIPKRQVLSKCITDCLRSFDRTADLRVQREFRVLLFSTAILTYSTFLSSRLSISE